VKLLLGIYDKRMLQKKQIEYQLFSLKGFSCTCIGGL